MAKNRNNFAKRQRETERKRKADEKRLRRVKKKEGPIAPVVPAAANPIEPESV